MENNVKYKQQVLDSQEIIEGKSNHIKALRVVSMGGMIGVSSR